MNVWRLIKNKFSISSIPFYNSYFYVYYNIVEVLLNNIFQVFQCVYNLFIYIYKMLKYILFTNSPTSSIEFHEKNLKFIYFRMEKVLHLFF